MISVKIICHFGSRYTKWLHRAFLIIVSWPQASHDFVEVKVNILHLRELISPFFLHLVSHFSKRGSHSNNWLFIVLLVTFIIYWPSC